MKIDPDQYYKIRDAARLLAVVPSTLHNWQEKGLLVPEMITPFGHRRYSGAQLIEFSKNQNEKDKTNG